MSTYKFNKSTLKRFYYWISERYSIHNKRHNLELDAPWTTDTVLQTQFFTNPFREDDKTTAWFCNNVRAPMAEDNEVLFATLLFRWFNSIPTGKFLMSLGNHHHQDPLWLFDPGNWNPSTATKLKIDLDTRQNAGGTLFGGAYIIKLANGEKKHHSVVDTLMALLTPAGTEKEVSRYEVLQDRLWGVDTLEEAHKYLTLLPYIGPFMAYEALTDLRHTCYFRQAEDIHSWANPGPGAFRGLRRLLNLPVEKRQDKSVPGGKKAAIAMMRQLLRNANAHLQLATPRQMETYVVSPVTFGKKYGKKGILPRLEMRDIEHSLCEFDKYERARTGVGGKMKRKFRKGVAS